MTQHIAHTPQIKRLERSSNGRMLAGVARGLGRYFDLNPAVFRLGFVVLTLLGGAGVLVYLAAVLVIPDEGNDQSIAGEILAERRDRPWPLVGLGLVGAALLILLSRGNLWPAAGAGWVLILVGGLIVLWASRHGGRGRRILIAATVSSFLLLAAAVSAAVVAFAWFDVSLSDGTGDRVYAPAAASTLKPAYQVGIGSLKLDLSQIDPTTPAHVRANVGIGELKVIVPRDATVAVDAHAKVGELFVLRHHDDGRDATVHTDAGGTLTIDARVGAGRIDVVRAG
jgi:phage shock protein PspC (stress-responsive transcriptional regulator)